MTQKDILLKEIENIPDELLKETLDYLRFLKFKRQNEILETALLSESSLKKDWLRPEEDEAWKNL